jgi:hypothetical protein
VNSKYAGIERRNPLYLAQLIPRMRSGSTMGDFNFAVGGGLPFNVNGTRSQDTLVTIDGAPAVRTRANGAIIGVAKVMTADYAPEYGRAAGGQIAWSVRAYEGFPWEPV